MQDHPQDPNERTSDGSHWTGTATSAKVATVSRFTSLFKSKQKKIVFPPPDWAQTPPRNEVGSSNNASSSPSSSVIMPSQSSDSVPHTESMSESQDELPPEPITLAKRIRSLLAASPPPVAPNTQASPVVEPNTEPTLHAVLPTPNHPVNLVDPDGPPLSPAVGFDSKLLKWLSSENVMNGSLAKGKQSVWTALENLRHSKKSQDSTGDSKTNDNSTLSPQEDDNDNDSIMLYAPLEPDSTSHAEIAESMIASEGPESSGTTTENSTHTIWMPHPTGLSLEALWWGYRLYLPPAVLNILDSSRIKAAQRAAMLTSVLKWLMDQIPNMIIPPQYRAGIRVIKSLTPYLGYVGVVITWSWGKIQSMDQGNGVILTATWLLPMALIPSTWKPGEPPTLGIPTAENPSLPEEISTLPATSDIPEETPEASPVPPAPQPSRLKSIGKYFSSKGESDATDTKGKGKQRAGK